MREQNLGYFSNLTHNHIPPIRYLHKTHSISIPATTRRQIF